MVKIALDAMGGDNAPIEIIKGAVDALEREQDVFIYLVGQETIINAALKGYSYDESRLAVVNATEVIDTGEHPVNAVRKKKDSSLVVAMNMVKEKKADALISAGNSGAVLVGGQTIVGRIKGVERPPFAPLIPTTKGVSILLDSGANVDSRPSHLVQWARMGSMYMKDVMGIDNPRVAIVNVGIEEDKGNALVKETYPLLKGCDDINFIGSIEAREIPNGGADVIVCDAFVGNVILKLYEGVGSALIGKVKESLMSSLKTKLGALLIKDSLKRTMKSFDSGEYGGAPMLGLKGLVVKTHGNSKAREIANAIGQCRKFKEEDINSKMAKVFAPKTLQSGEDAVQ